MNHTSEQQTILTHVSTTDGLSLIDSVAGSGKTTMLVSIAKAIPHTNGLYIAYGKAIATEASRKFPKTTKCMTTHKLAYAATVGPYKLKLGEFNYRSITERILYDQKLQILDAIREFCLSRFTSFKQYCLVNDFPANLEPLAQRYLDAMVAGTIECTHELYLKLFHILLSNGSITYDPFDFIMLDEAGDLNEVTLEIFRLLPSDKKIAVGDPLQNIFTFNHTINCFDVLAGEGTLFRMSQSFRVADYIAPRIEHFCQRYLDPAMSFIGVPVTDTTIKSRGYITRTNSALIARMIELNQTGTPYGLVRKASEIFKMPLMLCSLKPKGFITEPAYKHLQSDVDDWYAEESIRLKYASPLSYIGSLHSEDFQLNQAIRLIARHGKAAVMNAFSEAKQHEKANQSLTLATAHSCKGLEFDEVTFAPDLNESVVDVLTELQSGRLIETLSSSERESLNLYYVAASRASKALHNAIHL